MLGASAEKVIVNKESTTIVNGTGDKKAIADRVAQIPQADGNLDVGL